jgi:quinol monooxygenase YgiN
MPNTVVHCTVDIFAKPESVEKVREILLALIEPSLKEEGCLYYKLFENVNDRYQFTFIETWTSESAFEDHLQSEHVQKASFAIYEDMTKQTDIKNYKSVQFESSKIKPEFTSRFCVLL